MRGVFFAFGYKCHNTFSKFLEKFLVFGFTLFLDILFGFKGDFAGQKFQIKIEPAYFFEHSTIMGEQGTSK